MVEGESAFVFPGTHVTWATVCILVRLHGTVQGHDLTLT